MKSVSVLLPVLLVVLVLVNIVVSKLAAAVLPADNNLGVVMKNDAQNLFASSLVLVVMVVVSVYASELFENKGGLGLLGLSGNSALASSGFGYY